MNHPSHQQDEYTQSFITGLEWIWGEGYLSPGGAQEVAELLRGVNLTDKNVLDIGCGLGAIDVLLVKQFNAAQVVGIDVESTLIERSRQAIAAAKLSEQISIMQVEPGPLPFDAASFDVVFSKDSIIHIPDKAALYTDVLTILRPGGVFIGSDWLRGGEGKYSTQMQAWLDIVELSFEMKNLDQTRAALEQAGFLDIRMRDRNEWYKEFIKDELATLSEQGRAGLADKVGKQTAEQRLTSCTAKQLAVENGDLRPCHFVGYKPAIV